MPADGEETKTTLCRDFVLHDDAAVREKLTVMTKWDAMMDDGRNDGEEFADAVEDFLEPGAKYRVTIELIGWCLRTR